MTASAYTAELRVLLCDNCGAPFDGPIDGGMVQCRYCRAQIQLLARSELPAFGPMPPSRVPEAERLRLLRAQENQPWLPPPSIARLFTPDCEIPESRSAEAFAVWQTARKRTAAQELDAAEELAFLNVVLGNQFLRANDWTRHRAMLESALEAFFLPRHRSVVAAELCLGACRKNDVAGAEAWLALCDPASDDLYADTEYRLARSAVAQAKGDFQGVLAALGQSGAETPVHDASDCGIAVTRANAWERLGQIERAVAELQTLMAKSRRHRETIARIVDNSGMCAESFPRAHRSIQQRSSRGKLLMTFGALLIGAGILTILAIVVGIFWAESAGASSDQIGVFSGVGAVLAVTLMIGGTVSHKLGGSTAGGESR